ncbi:MAG TPA: hypothetical protein VEW08_09170, partial [Steroidobacteraceae bacterium]|nr:hypothetical protein [Steroidobacteraceae bacterium]
YVVFAGAYNEPDLLHLVELDRDEKATLVDTFRLVDINENPVSIERIVGRGKKLYALAGETVHVIDADDVIALS